MRVRWIQEEFPFLTRSDWCGECVMSSSTESAEKMSPHRAHTMHFIAREQSLHRDCRDKRRRGQQYREQQYSAATQGATVQGATA